MKHCTHCSESNPDSYRFCAKCGESLKESGAKDANSGPRISIQHASSAEAIGSGSRIAAPKKNAKKLVAIGVLVVSVVILAITIASLQNGNNGRTGTAQTSQSGTIAVADLAEDELFRKIRPGSFTEDDCDKAFQEATDRKCGPDKDPSTVTPAENDRHFSCVKGLNDNMLELRKKRARPHTCAAIYSGCPNTGTYITNAPGVGWAIGCAGVGGKDQ